MLTANGVADQDLRLSYGFRYNCQERIFGLRMSLSSGRYSNGPFRLNFFLLIYKNSFQYVLSYTCPVCGFHFCTTLKLSTFSIWITVLCMVLCVKLNAVKALHVQSGCGGTSEWECIQRLVYTRGGKIYKSKNVIAVGLLLSVLMKGITILCSNTSLCRILFSDL